MTAIDETTTTTRGATAAPVAETPRVSFDTSPDVYRHWRLEVDGNVATLTLAVDPDGGLVPGYELKMNSYDLGVDIELYDATQRLRFEHPGVKAVVVTGGLDRMFCSGANIKMLAQSTHGWKVNFCKFTNETRNGIEDATASSGQTYIAKINGTAAGGGYELALACDELVLVDDGSSAVSLPEVPLLGVLPGTGGLTRVVDKRGVRKDLADVFATKSDGVKGPTAAAWHLVDAAVPRGRFDDEIAERARAAARRSTRPEGATGVPLTPLDRTDDGSRLTYPHVEATLDRDARRVDITVSGPTSPPPDGAAAVLAEGVDYWPLALARALDDLVLRLRTNEPALGTWVFRTSGDAAAVLAYDAQMAELSWDWFVDEVRHYLRRTFKRLDVTSRSLIALIEPGSCYAGTLLELALACDRQYMLDGVLEDAVQHVLAVAGQRQLQQSAGVAAARLDQRDQAAAGHVEPLERAPQVVAHLVDEPVPRQLGHLCVVGEHGRGVARGAEHPGAEGELVGAESQHEVVEGAGQSQRPVVDALREHRGGPVGRRGLRPADGDVDAAGLAVQARLDVGVGHAVAVVGAVQGGQGDAGRAVRPARTLGGGPRALGDLVIEATAGDRGVHQAPCGSGRPLDAVALRGEHVGEVLADVALVDDAGEPAGAGQDAEQGNLRQRDGRRPVVHQDQLVARQRQLVPAAGRGAVDLGDVGLAGAGCGVLDAVASLVGELAEVHLPAVRRLRQHLDVGPGAEHPVQSARDHHRLDARVLEPQPLGRVVELDVDPEVVGVHLQLIARHEAAVRVHREGERRHVAVDLEAPVAVHVGRGVEGDAGSLGHRRGGRATGGRRGLVDGGHRGPPGVDGDPLLSTWHLRHVKCL